MADKKEKLTEKSSSKGKTNLPYLLQRAIDYAPSNQESIKVFLEKVVFKNFDDAVALREMLKVIEACSKVKAERISRRNNGQSVLGINTDYEVIVTEDNLSKKLVSIIRNVKSLKDGNLENIQSHFVKNKFDEIQAILKSNSHVVKEVDSVLTVLSSKLSHKVKTGEYEENSIILELLRNYSDEEILKIMNSRKSKVKEQAAS